MTTQFSCYSGFDPFFEDFITKAIGKFYSELNFYSTHNNDPEILEYANEQTLSSLFVNGLIRNDTKKQISALQEYGVSYQNGGRWGRPDIFLKINATAFFIECKYDKTCCIRDDHWDIPSWLDWDRKAILNQALDYYSAEELNDSYSKSYVVTLAFKLIDDPNKSHIQTANNNMLTQKDQLFDRNWFYAYQCMNTDLTAKDKGLEVYGTMLKMEN